MSEIEENKELKDSLLKCRCCLRILIDDRRAVEIDDQIREQFFSLCQISVRNLTLFFPLINFNSHLLAFKIRYPCRTHLSVVCV